MTDANAILQDLVAWTKQWYGIGGEISYEDRRGLCEEDITLLQIVKRAQQHLWDDAIWYGKNIAIDRHRKVVYLMGNINLFQLDGEIRQAVETVPALKGFEPCYWSSQGLIFRLGWSLHLGDPRG